MYNLMQFAATEPGSEGLFEALGIDLQLLIVQTVSFLILLAVLNKFVFPHLLKAIDKRQATIEATSRAAEEASRAAEEAKNQAGKILDKAKNEAQDILNLAQTEAAATVEQAEKRAEKRAEHVLSQAEARIESDIAAAKSDLRQEVISLVALATERVIGEKLDDKKDSQMIKTALESALKESK